MAAALERASAEGEPTILIVDDVPMFRELESLFLSRYGQVRTAGSAAEALAAAEAQVPDVAVLDLHLPDLDGDALCRALHALPGGSETLVILVTGGGPDEHVRAVRAGAADVIAKPLSREVLVESVRRFVATPGRPRGLPRVDLAAPVRLKIGPDEKVATVRNVSRGGMFVESRFFPEEGSELGLEFALPDHPERLSSTATLVWRRLRPNGGRAGLGLRFLALDGATACTLDAFVHERCQGPRSGL